MPTYRYRGPRDSEHHEVVAAGYERDANDETRVAFHNVTSFDGQPHRTPQGSLLTLVEGDIDVISFP